MNMKEMKEMLQLMKDHGLAEIEIEKDGLKLKLRKAGSGYAEQGMDGGSGMIVPMMRPIEPAAGTAGKPSQPAAEEGYIVRSPMVGTFYSAPAPDQPSYVSVGQPITKGSVLCIIEAMKLMNEIKTEVGGIVMEVLVSNGQAVEFDQPLFKIKTS